MMHDASCAWPQSTSASLVQTSARARARKQQISPTLSARRVCPEFRPLVLVTANSAYPPRSPPPRTSRACAVHAYTLDLLSRGTMPQSSASRPKREERPQSTPTIGAPHSPCATCLRVCVDTVYMHTIHNAPTPMRTMQRRRARSPRLVVLVRCPPTEPAS
ncbi:hypothetical protein BC628DRAFT_1404662 [Trametes gibbosa]|nr:hypothetical protein BC628DRAFT_1404662 [Trametes gibbosa]